MRHILTSFLTLHWMAIFAVLAVVCVIGSEGGGSTTPSGLFASSAFAPAMMPSSWSSAAFAVAFCTVAALFLWLFVTATFGDGSVSQDAEEIARLAFATAVGSLTLLFVVQAATSPLAHLTETAIFVAALVASYLAIFAERWSGLTSAVADEEELHDAARLMAASAAHNSMLSRLSGRDEIIWGEQR